MSEIVSTSIQNGNIKDVRESTDNRIIKYLRENTNFKIVIKGADADHIIPVNKSVLRAMSKFFSVYFSSEGSDEKEEEEEAKAKDTFILSFGRYEIVQKVMAWIHGECPDIKDTEMVEFVEVCSYLDIFDSNSYCETILKEMQLETVNFVQLFQHMRQSTIASRTSCMNCIIKRLLGKLFVNQNMTNEALWEIQKPVLINFDFSDICYIVNECKQRNITTANETTYDLMCWIIVINWKHFKSIDSKDEHLCNQVHELIKSCVNLNNIPMGYFHQWIQLFRHVFDDTDILNKLFGTLDHAEKLQIKQHECSDPKKRILILTFQ